jgi:hypothetical protein
VTTLPTAAMLWTIRASMALYLAALGLQLAPGHRRLDGPARAAWTAGAALLVVHVLLAFHVAHHWDHADALRHTAERTQALTGVRSGAGVYLNYLVMTVWTADAAYWWRAGADRYRRRRRPVAAGVHGFLLFMAFNATVVFADGWTRWLSAAGFGVLAVLAVQRFRLRLRRT